MTTSVDIQQVWKEYHVRLYAFILKRVGDKFLAEDLLQDIFLKIQSKSHTIQSDDKIQSWLYQISRNTIIDYFRTHKKVEKLPESIASESEQQVDITRYEFSQCLMPMIQNLPSPYREAILESEINGLKQKEVAQIQNISLSGAKSRIQRGRSMLKDMLLECCHIELDHKGRIIDYEEKKANCNCDERKC